MTRRRCKCGFCADARNERSVCCFHVKKSEARFSKHWQRFLGDTDLCFGEHPRFLAIVKNKDDLEYFIQMKEAEVKQLAARRNDVFTNQFDPLYDDPNARFRYGCYRKIANVVHGSDVRGIRIELPACVENVIRKTYPFPDGFYTGFEDIVETE